MPEVPKYKVIRYFRTGGKKTLFKGVDLRTAQLHCSSPMTHKLDSKGNVVWFDGYTKE